MNELPNKEKSCFEPKEYKQLIEIPLPHLGRLVTLPTADFILNKGAKFIESI